MNDIKAKAHIFASIFTLANRLQILGDKFDRNLTIKQWLLLACIYKCESEAPTISEVAELTGSSRQNVKKMALILEREGFVHLQKDPNDARALRIGLTEKCRVYFKEREDRELDFLEKLYIGFDADLIMCLKKAISKLEENITELEKEYYEEDKR